MATPIKEFIPGIQRLLTLAGGDLLKLSDTILKIEDRMNFLERRCAQLEKENADLKKPQEIPVT